MPAPLLTSQEVEKRLDRAIAQLLDEDVFLFSQNAHERSVTHKLAGYLQQEFPTYNVDCEYNREGYEKTVKQLDFLDDVDDTRNVFPDVIVHQRGINSKNLLVLEVKLNATNKEKKKDVQKLEAFTDVECNIQYQYGLFIDFSTGERVTENERLWIAEGESRGRNLCN